ncbi:ParB/RepB/Spo0J family partition protein [Alterisphingorhabdus coralli]|uniref:ParB/RepB/Spo0J family partition protein n=1 Tax=Alterisphingorhabdus coralli TaxID=3071408 RepID=A0AA97F6U3_9SPHN|nr:ParB/RepB/Spo0J family partition protein [Parasphingorhabdus sp. SCSIO 66989]WOE75444.1 ParB/RepB/Spo0J family partition protein [Parasphingorhabdus sp. SCSIO 66989]
MSESTETKMTKKKNSEKKGDKKASVKKTVAASKRPSGLGRGLSALLGEARPERPIAARSAEAGSVSEAEGTTIAAPPAANGVASISVANIAPHPDQPRRYFADAALDELAASIAQRGVIQPIIVRPANKSGHYQLVAGERRWRAAQRARLHEIPAIVRDLDDEQTLAIALIENIQREDLTPVEEARAYKQMTEQQQLSPADLAQLVDKSRSHVVNMMRLLALPDAVLEMVDKGDLSMGHARALINSPAPQDLAQRVVKQGLSVREVEKLARAGDAPKPSKQKLETKSAPLAGQAESDIAAVERHLSDLLGMNVSIKPGANGTSGDISVRYSSLDQLDLLCQRLSGDFL